MKNQDKNKQSRAKRVRNILLMMLLDIAAAAAAYFNNSNKPFLCERNKEKVFVSERK